MREAVFSRVSGRAAVLFGLLVFLSGAMMALGAGGGSDADEPAVLPSTFPAFVMELERVVDGAVQGTTVVTYNSADDWLYEEFDNDGTLVSSERLASGRLTITSGRYGVVHVADIGSGETVIPVPWFVPSATMLGRGASRAGSLPEFTLNSDVPCADADPRCAPGASTFTLALRARYDLTTGIPVGYTEAHNGREVVALRLIRLEVD